MVGMTMDKDSTFGQERLDFPNGGPSDTNYWSSVVSEKAGFIAAEMSIVGEDKIDFQQDCVLAFLALCSNGKFKPVNDAQAHKFLWLFCKRRGYDWLRVSYAKHHHTTLSLDNLEFDWIENNIDFDRIDTDACFEELVGGEDEAMEAYSRITRSKSPSTSTREDVMAIRDSVLEALDFLTVCDDDEDDDLDPANIFRMVLGGVEISGQQRDVLRGFLQQVKRRRSE